MSIAVQTVANTSAVNTLAALGSIAQAAQKSNSLFFSPDVISILSGSASSTPVTYNAAGLIESVLQVADASGSSGGASGSATAQALAALLARNFNPSAPNGADALTANQDLARLLAAAPNSATTSTDANAAAASVYDAAGMLLGLPSDGTATAQSNLLFYELGRAAAAGTAATAASGTDALLALKSLLLANVDLTAAAKAAVTSSSASAGTSAGTSGVVSTIASTPAATPAVTTAADAIAATTAAAVSSTTADTANTATAFTATGNAGDTTGASGALTNNFVQDTAAQALANIEANPAYANAVSGLYMSVAIFRAQQALAAGLNAAGSIQPISAVPNVIDAAWESNV